MVMVPVTALKSGERLAEEVRTALGNVLMEKGKTIGARDIEIFKAFMVKLVSVEGKMKEEQSPPEETPSSLFVSNELALFYRAYDELYQMMKKAFHAVSLGNDKLPLLEVRARLEHLLYYLDSYNPLTFTVRRSQEYDYLIQNGILVGLTSCLLAKWQGIQQKEWIQIALAGILHDIGTVRVDDAILQKPSKLTSSEFDELKRHTVIGYNILKNNAGLNDGVKFSALQHHEREDGSGYPLGLKGDKIHPYAKLIALSDMFHAMTTNRQYKKASSPYLVLEQLLNEAFGRLDPATVQTFIKKVTQFHNGTVVRLNDGNIAEIVFTDLNHPTRPMVNVNGKIINLATERDKFIQEVVSN